jgi:uncharacterized protein
VRFEHQAVIPAPKAKVWAFLMDVPKVGLCVPGVESIEPLGGDRYRGTMRVSVGPIKLTLRGDAEVVEKDEAAGRAAMQANGVDQKASGSVKAVMTMTLRESASGDASTELHVTTDAQVMGKLGEFGQPIIRKKADQMMDQFAQNLRQRITQGP